jgi:uncharacterized protein YndB with AHSA1/START domain
VRPPTHRQVWVAWTDPATVARWFSPNPSLAVVAVTGRRAGETWSVVMGNYAVRGEYVEFDPPRLLAFTWAFDHEPDTAQTLVEVNLEPVGDGTLLVLTHSRFTDSSDREGVEQGWTLSLDRLVELDL